MRTKRETHLQMREGPLSPPKQRRKSGRGEPSLKKSATTPQVSGNRRQSGVLCQSQPSLDPSHDAQNSLCREKGAEAPRQVH